MRSFESLMEDIKKNREVAATDLGANPDPRTYTTKLGHIKRAKENLTELFLEYRKQVMDKAIFILTQGKNQAGFVEIATKEEYGCFALSAEEVYEEIASKVDARYYQNQESSPALFDIFMSSFNDICNDVGIVGYPAVLFESKYRRRLTSKKDLIKLIKEAFNDKVGSDLVGLYAVDKVARKAVNSGYAGKTIPIILHSKDKDLTNLLLESLTNINPNVFKVTTVQEQTNETVEQQLTKISQAIKQENP